MAESSREAEEKPSSERTPDYTKLLEYGLDKRIAGKLDDIFKTGKHMLVNFFFYPILNMTIQWKPTLVEAEIQGNLRKFILHSGFRCLFLPLLIVKIFFFFLTSMLFTKLSIDTYV